MGSPWLSPLELPKKLRREPFKVIEKDGVEMQFFIQRMNLGSKFIALKTLSRKIHLIES